MGWFVAQVAAFGRLETKLFRGCIYISIEDFGKFPPALCLNSSFHSFYVDIFLAVQRLTIVRAIFFPLDQHYGGFHILDQQHSDWHSVNQNGGHPMVTSHFGSEWSSLKTKEGADCRDATQRLPGGPIVSQPAVRQQKGRLTRGFTVGCPEIGVFKRRVKGKDFRAAPKIIVFRSSLFWLSPLKCIFFCVSFQLDVPLACSQHMQLVPFLVRNLRKPSVTPTHKRLLCGDALIPIRHGHGSKKEHPLNGLGVYTIDHHQPLLSITNHQPLQAIVTITTTI